MSLAFLIQVQSAIVARVRIVKETPVFLDAPTLDINGLKEPCGFIYDAEVVQGFKGGDNPFRFYSGARQEFRGFDRDYLVFLFKSVNETREDKALETDYPGGPVYSERMVCFVRSGQINHVHTASQTMFSFDPDAAKALGGEWLAPSFRAHIDWCRIVPWRGLDQELFHDGRATPILWNQSQLPRLFGWVTEPIILNWKSAQKQIETALGSFSAYESACG